MTQHLPYKKATPMSGAVFNKELPTVQGGRFELGFISAFTSSLALSYTTGKSNDPLAIMGIGAAIGGTAEALGGGKFANGAVTGAFVGLFNDMMHQSSRNVEEYDNQKDAYARADEIPEHAGYHFIKKDDGSNSNLYVIDLDSNISDTEVSFETNIINEYQNRGYVYQGMFHGHPGFNPFATTADIENALRMVNTGYMDVINRGRVYRYKASVRHAPWQTVIRNGKTTSLYLPVSTFKY